jgi:hypothetical protein
MLSSRSMAPKISDRIYSIQLHSKGLVRHASVLSVPFLCFPSHFGPFRLLLPLSLFIDRDHILSGRKSDIPGSTEQKVCFRCAVRVARTNPTYQYIGGVGGAVHWETKGESAIVFTSSDTVTAAHIFPVPRNLILDSLLALLRCRIPVIVVFVPGSVAFSNMSSMWTLARCHANLSTLAFGRRRTPDRSTTDDWHLANCIVVLLCSIFSDPKPGSQSAILILTFSHSMHPCPASFFLSSLRRSTSWYA